MTNLNAYFKNEISSLKRFVESNKEKANLPIYRLYKHLSYHRRASIHSFESDTINRGENFKYSPPILSRVDLDELYFYLLTIPDILESSYNIADERTKIGYKLVAQIAAHDFPYFVNKLAPPLFETENEKLHNLTAALSRIILDPTTGFLANAPHNPKNDVWHDKDHNFDFFNVESSDLKTPFGKALWDYREKLNHLLFSYFTDKTNTRSTEFDYITTFTPSFLNFIQSTIVPPNFPYQKLSCGFSQRAQILLAFSRIQDLEYFSKNKSYRVEKSYAACQKWIDILNDDETESMTLTQVSSLEFHKPVNIQNSVKYRLLKLIVFLNPTGLSSQKNIDQYIVSGILGSDKVMTGFMIFIFQAIVFIYPKLSFLIMDAIFSKIDTYIVQNAAQHYTIIHSLTRYVDILSCLPERYLDTEQITKANAFAICGLASANPYVRIASNKLMSVLSSYETDDKNICAYSFLNRNKEHFEKILIEFYAKDPRVQFKDMSHHALLPMAFDDAMKSISSTLWCRFIRLISRRGNEEWPDSLKTYVVKYGYQLITFHVEKNLHSLDIGCIGTMFTLVGGLENKCCNELNEKLIQSLVILVFNYYDAYYTNIIVMLNVVRPRFYKLIIRSMIKIIDETNSRHNALSLVIRVIAQNKEFEKYMRDPELANLFIDALDKLFYSLNIDYHVEFDHSFITKYSVDLLHAATSLHTMLFNKYKKKDITPFPCWPCLLTNESRPECDRIQGRIKHAIYLAKVDVFEENKIFHYWAMKCLSSLCMIITIKDTKMLFNDTFNEILVEFASEEHNIIAYILSNHFLLLFSRYIELALMPDGMPFFNAICRFFRTKHPKKFASSVIKEVLYHQWTASVNISQDSQFTEMLQWIADLYVLFLFKYNIDGGSAFILLATITPLLIIVHNKGRPEKIAPVLRVFTSVSDQFIQSVAGIDQYTVRKLSAELCPPLLFCIEQVFSTCFTFLPNYPIEIFNDFVPILLPWFEAVKLDLDNRVISHHSDLLFIQFSCISFIERLISAFSPFSGESINSSLFALWRALLLDKQNFEIIIIVLILESMSIKNHNQMFFIVRYMYKIRPKETLNQICKILCFSFYFHEMPVIESLSNILGAHLLDNEGSESTNTDLSGNSNPYISLTSFALFVLYRLTQDAINPIISHLPKILAFCCIFLDQHFYIIRKLMIALLNKLEGFADLGVMKASTNLRRVIAVMPSDYETLAGKPYKEIIEKETSINKSISLTKRINIAHQMKELLFNLNEKYPKQFGTELLAWGFCCNDLHRAAFAMKCFIGVGEPVDSFIMSLSARSLWHAVDAAAFLVTSNVYDGAILYYIQTMIDTYIGVFDKISNETAVFWIAISCLQCNTADFQHLFNSSLELLELFLTNTNFLAYVAKRSDYKTGMWTTAAYLKYKSPDFHGCLRNILGYTGRGCNIDRMIKVINLLIQNSLVSLISDTEHCILACILCLLPWIWSVITTDMTRYMYDTPQVQCLHGTMEVLNELVDDQNLLELIMKLFQDDVDIYKIMEDIIAIIIPQLNKNETKYICYFFTNMLLFGNKYVVIPLYSICSNIIKYSHDKSISKKALRKFTVVVKCDKKLSRETYRNHYLNHVYKNSKMVSFEDSGISNCRTNSLNKLRESEVTKRISNPLSYKKSHRPQSLNGLTDQEYNKFLIYLKDAHPKKKNRKFPELSIFSRIVAINIPQYYVFEVSEDDYEFDFDNAKSFPPLLPYNATLMKNEYFSNIAQQFKSVVFNDQRRSVEVMEKLRPPVINEDTISILKSRGEGIFTRIKTTFLSAIKILKEEEKKKKLNSQPKPETADQVIVDDDLTISLVNPYDMIVIPAVNFKPNKKVIEKIIRVAKRNYQK